MASNSSFPPLTAAELLRRNVKRSREKTEKKESVDLDEEIRRLEQELNDDSSSTSSSTEESENDKQAEDSAVLNLSAVKNETIESLPEQFLPRIKKQRASEQSSPITSQTTNPGLASAVQEILDGYVPRSAERLPFYCRVCAKQYKNEQEFFAHRETEFHKVAFAAERKASYCHLCRKQLTSPAQLKEHLSSRPHKERLERVRRNHRDNRSR
jgi:hypothetical protein